MNKSKVCKTVLFLLMIIILTYSASALGITPGRKTIEFIPGAEGEVEVALINNENKDMRVAIYFEGDQNIVESIKLSSALIEMKASEAEKKFKYTYKLPKNLVPGTSELRLVARELPNEIDNSGSLVGATVAVVHQIHINVPYPGKYASLDLKIAETGATDRVNFILAINSLGTQKIVNARGVIDVYGPTNEKIATLTTSEASIESGQKIELTAEWNENVNVGSYLVKAIITYDGETSQEVQKIITVGTQGLELLDINVNDFRLGQIARFNLLVQNNWNQKIKELFAEMIVYTLDDKEVIRFKSATEEIDPLGKQELTAFWDTAGIEEGEYKLSLILNNENKPIEKDIRMVVSLDSIRFIFDGLTGRAIGGTGELQTGTIITVGIAVLVLIVGAVFFFRKGKKKK